MRMLNNLVVSAQTRVSGPIVWSTGLLAHNLGSSPPPSSSMSGICLSVCFCIDLIHKWRLINYSFVFMLIILTSLTLKQKFF